MRDIFKKSDSKCETRSAIDSDSKRKSFKNLTSQHIQVGLIILLVIFLVGFDLYYFISFLINSIKL